MKISILSCNVLVPLIMIYIGILCKNDSSKKVNKILNIFMPISSASNGVGYIPSCDSLKEKMLLKQYSRKLSMIWTISGIVTFIITAVVLITNKSDILSAKTFLDNSNVSVIMLEVELAIVLIVFASVQFVLKKNYYKKAIQY